MDCGEVSIKGMRAPLTNDADFTHTSTHPSRYDPKYVKEYVDSTGESLSCLSSSSPNPHVCVLQLLFCPHCFTLHVQHTSVWPRGELSVAEWWDDDRGTNPAFTTAEMLERFVDSMDGHVGAFDFALKVCDDGHTAVQEYGRVPYGPPSKVKAP